MRIRNLAKDTKTIISNGNVFSGTVDGQTYTATADSQLLRLWGNIILPMPSSGGTMTGIDNNTVAIFPDVTVLARLCGYEDASLVTMLKTANLPLVFAAADHPY